LLQEERFSHVHKAQGGDTSEYYSVREEWPLTQISGAAFSCANLKEVFI